VVPLISSLRSPRCGEGAGEGHTMLTAERLYLRACLQRGRHGGLRPPRPPEEYVSGRTRGHAAWPLTGPTQKAAGAVRGLLPPASAGSGSRSGGLMKKILGAPAAAGLGAPAPGFSRWAGTMPITRLKKEAS
jgi:hypothetical protein